MLIIVYFSSNKYQTSKYFSTTFLSSSVLHHNLLYLVLEHGKFLNTGDSHGSVATSLRHCVMYNNFFIANILVSPPLKEF